jgi:hypothetical protein
MATLSIGACACSSDDDQADTIGCRQKADADHDDCEGRSDMRTRKMDCDTEAQEREARAAGCVAEDESNTESNDMCCPPSVSGVPD